MLARFEKRGTASIPRDIAFAIGIHVARGNVIYITNLLFFAIIANRLNYENSNYYHRFSVEDQNSATPIEIQDYL